MFNIIFLLKKFKYFHKLKFELFQQFNLILQFFYFKLNIDNKRNRTSFISGKGIEDM